MKVVYNFDVFSMLYGYFRRKNCDIMSMLYVYLRGKSSLLVIFMVKVLEL